MTVDYDGERAAPEPVSAVVANFLSRSFSVATVLRRAARGWLFGLVGLVVGFAFGVYTIWVTPPTYSVSIGLLPTDAAGDISAVADGGGALGALAGLIGVGGGPVPKFTRFVASLYATGVAEIMDRDHDMVCRTFSGDCDITTHTWRKHTGFDAWVQGVRAQIAHLPSPDSPRTTLDLANNTESQVTMLSDRTTHVLTLTMESPDPKFAALYLQALVAATNKFVKTADRGNIVPYVNYLNQKLASNLNLTQHDALSTLLLEQERRLMLSSVDVPYAAAVQDGPNVTASNSALRILLVDTVMGLILGAAGGMLWAFWRARRRTRSAAWPR